MTRVPSIAMALVLGAVVLGAASTGDAQSQPPAYGSQMMTDQERNAHRDRMHSAETAEERDRVRSKHHEQMRSRAAECGMTLPDTPPGPGMRDRQGPGSGYGRGPGGGMGPGGPNGRRLWQGTLNLPDDGRESVTPMRPSVPAAA